MDTYWLQLWSELRTDAGLRQLGVVLASLLSAWAFNHWVARRVMQGAPESWKVGVGGIKRVLFPLTALALVTLGRVILSQWQSIELLKLASTLLLAMAGIRLTVYTLRYVFAPSGWMRATENAIVAVIWCVVALHLTGLLPSLAALLDGAGFSAGGRKVSVLLILQALLTAAVTLIAALWIGRLLENKVMGAERIDLNLRVVLTKLLRILLIIVGVLAALSAVGFDITLLSVFGGALGVGLGFGLQKIASNYLSGFIILLDRSLHMGDVLTVDGHYGVVHQLHGRYLVLRKLDGTEVVIPNDTLITSTVINHSYSDRNARVQLALQVGYDADLEEAMRLLRETAEQHPRVLPLPGPDVTVQALADNGIELQLSVWVDDPEEGFGSLKSALYLEILRRFRERGIAIPYPQREVRILA